jgi:hypothetical protein
VITKRPGRTSRHRAGLRGPEPNGTIGAPGLSGRSSSHIRRRRDGFTHLAPRRHDGPAGATASSCARTRREHHDGGTAGAEGEIKHRVLLGSRRSMRRGCAPADLHHVGGRYPISAPRVPIQWCLLLAGPQMRRDVVAALTAFSRRRRCGRRPIARDEVTLGDIRRGRLVLDVGRLGSSRGTGDHQADPASASFSCRPPTHPSSRRSWPTRVAPSRVSRSRPFRSLSLRLHAATSPRVSAAPRTRDGPPCALTGRASPRSQRSSAPRPAAGEFRPAGR